jgi:hypothetical protein
MQAMKVSDCRNLQALPVLVAASRSQLAGLFSIEFASSLLVFQFECYRPLVDAVLCPCAHQCLLVSQSCHVHKACDQGCTRTCATECCPRPLLLKISNCSPRMLRLRIGRKVMAPLGTLQTCICLTLPMQLEKDYRAWASGDESRKPLGTGEL